MKSKPTDALGRQWRWFPKAKEGDSFREKEEDWTVFEYWARFAPVGLPTWMGHKGAPHLKYVPFQRRMTQYKKFGYFDIELWQTARLPSPENRHLVSKNPLINRLSEKTIKGLHARNLLHPNAPKSSSSPQHDAFLNYIYGSFMEGKGLWQHQILDRLGKKGTLIEVDGKTVVPDAVFMINPGKRYLIFLEVDRDTEPNVTKTKRRNWEDKLDAYHTLITKGKYKDIFQFDGGALLCIVTNSEPHLNNILSLTNHHFILGQSYPYFQNTYMVIPNQYAPVYGEWKTPTGTFTFT